MSVDIKYLKSENIYWSAVKGQWLVAYNHNDKVKGLQPVGWYDSKKDALVELKRILTFRLGLVADCTILYKRLDDIDREIKRQEEIYAINRQ
jgi:hypothetical protein